MINNLVSLLGITNSSDVELVLSIMVMALIICLSYKFLDFMFTLINSFFTSDKIRF